MKKILIPTDFSKISVNAARYIMELYSEAEVAHKPSFVIYHSLHIPQVPSGGIGLALSTAQSLEETNKRLDDEKSFWQKEYPSFNIESVFSMGPLESKLYDLSKESEIDLIVVGSLGINGIDRWLLKTSAIDIAKNAEVPVMVIPEDITYKTIRKSIFAADFNSLNIIPALPPIKQLMRTMDAELTLLQIQQNGSDHSKQNSSILAFLDNYFGKTELHHDVLKAEHTADNLESYFDRHGAELLILLDRDRNLFEMLFHADVTRKLIWQASIPLLILHENDFSEKPEMIEILNDQIHAQIKNWQDTIKELKENLQQGQEKLQDKWKTKTTDMIDNMKDMEETIRELKLIDKDKWDTLYEDLNSKIKKVQEKLPGII
jgi:nucleotide-binding universal stress UspA family protein